MPVPPFEANGDLPIGIHPMLLKEAVARFGMSTARHRVMAARLERIYQTAVATGHLARIVVFGSFITSKPEPNDVDVVLLMEDDFDASHLTGEGRLLFDHSAADTFFGASVFWLRKIAAFGGEQATLEYWQTKCDGTLRGIIEIVREQDDNQ